MTNGHMHSNKLDISELKLLTSKDLIKSKALSKSFSKGKCNIDGCKDNSTSLLDKIMSASQMIASKINIFSNKETMSEADKPKENEEDKIDELHYEEHNHSHDHFDSDINEFIDELEKYVEHNHDMIKTECYFCTKTGKIKGMLTLKQEMIIFDPLKCEENSKLIDLGKHHCLINLKDIINAQVVKFPNETAQYIKDEKVRQCYIYDYYLKLETKCQK